MKLYGMSIKNKEQVSAESIYCLNKITGKAYRKRNGKNGVKILINNIFNCDE
ncbi:hypothetical protein D3C79_1100720 [compost metagenome]